MLYFVLLYVANKLPPSLSLSVYCTTQNILEMSYMTAEADTAYTPAIVFWRYYVNVLKRRGRGAISSK